MKKKILSIFLAALTLCSVFASCKDKSGNGSTNSQESVTSGQDSTGNQDGSSEEREEVKETVDVTDNEQHLVSDTKRLHQNNNDYSKMKPFVVNGQSEYVIIDGAGTYQSKEATDYMKKQIGACTGYYPEVYSDVDHDGLIDDEDVADRNIAYSETAKYIVFSHPALEAAAGVQWEEGIDLDYSGYMIKTVGDSVFMKINSHYGYQHVMLAFLREVLGYEWYAADMIVYTKDGSQMPTFDLVEKPDFDLTWRSGYIASKDKIGSGVSSSETFTFINGNFCHNSFDYLPYETYKHTHRKWYSDVQTNLVHGGTGIGQLCYSAHGDKEEYDAMLQTAFEGVKQTLIEQPDRAALTFTREDHQGHCECDTCKAVMNEFNGSHAALYMFFVNDLDTLIQEWLAEEAEKNGTEKRDVTVLFFAYSQTASAPVFGENGNYTVPSTRVDELDDGTKYNYVLDSNEDIVELPYNKTYENGLKCNENVGVFYAPIDAAFAESFYHKENKRAKETFEKWSLLSNRLYCWIYDTMFTDYLVPYNSFDAIPETIRFLKDVGGQFLFNQAQGENVSCTGFGSIKTFLNYELPRDVNQDTGEMMDRFFANYFRDAAKPMREYYEMMVAYMEQLQEDYPNIFHTGRRQDTDQPEYWDYETLCGWLELCEDAKLAVAKYKTTNYDLYQTLMKHITIETIFPRWMICQYYDGYYNPNELQEMRTLFANDCTVLGIGNYSEAEKIAPIFASWGVTIDPSYKIA